MAETKPKYTLSSLLDTLLPTVHLTKPPPHPTHPSLTPVISSLLLHPTIEAALHLLNADLPSAHFLVRHMQAPPAIEGMLLHSILHRSEGDIPNARAWASDAVDASDGWVPKHKGEERLDLDTVQAMKGKVLGGARFVEFVYGGDKAGAERLIDDVERWRKKKGAEGGNELAERVRAELGKVLEWCRKKFGEEEWTDASAAWVKHGEEVRKMGEDMVSGAKEFRDF
ncbi:uncharacterized protein CC84DRAFT_1153902 [Paraphaeosphaeria sporulosa]|uniref:Uncharacterized protein n=1 Tax=Paraphaeosphaeria sporulosa TaxID=1460663 RepID=A0A177C2W6_9PLEO|nr:uncharacterized protein CC84DRAFT_1153902 [Paraphaeosphaeria sporulosa]OAG01795.1 hypothetical protein CC84DRAFT_1153902 [Paraphaeosphaeria sporulosa]